MHFKEVTKFNSGQKQKGVCVFIMNVNHCYGKHFKDVSNINDGALFQKQLKAKNLYSHKKLHRRCLEGSFEPLTAYEK